VAKIPKSLILILLLGLGLRLINLSQSFWLDEASQGLMSRQAVAWIWSGRAADFHPPLFYLIAHYWMYLNRSEIWLRLPSVIFGVLNIYLIYLLVRDLHLSRKLVLARFKISPEILAALFLAINPFHIYYSQEFRSYMLLCFLGTWSMRLLLREQFKSLCLVNTLLIYTHYSSLFLLLTELVYVLVYNRKKLPDLLFSMFWMFIFYLPWLPQLFKQLSSGTNIDNYLPGWRNILSLSPLKTLPLTIFKLVAGRITLLSWPLYLIYGLFVITVVFLSFRATAQQKNFLFTWIFVPVIFMILTSFLFPQNQPFRVIYIIPGLIIVFVQACLRYPKLFTTFFIYIFIFGNVMYFTRGRLQREQWRQTIDFLHHNSSINSAVVVKFSDAFSPFYWYDPGLKVFPTVSKFPSQAPDVANKLGFLTSPQYSQVYLLEYLTDLTDPGRNTENVLKDLGFVLDKTYDYSGVGFVRLYTRI
jgi:uncharacterized membrane protein